MFRDMHVDHIEFNARASQIAPRVTAWRSRAATAPPACREFEPLPGFAPNLAALEASGEGGYHIASQSRVKRLGLRVGERFRGRLKGRRLFAQEDRTG